MVLTDNAVCRCRLAGNLSECVVCSITGVTAGWHTVSVCKSTTISIDAILRDD